MTNLVFHQATQKVKVLQWTEKLCRCLEQQYRDYSVRSIVNNQNKADKPDPYLQEKVNQIESGEDDRISFFIENGRKYYKVCLRWKQVNRQFKDDISVHCFVDKLSGEVYKPAGWKQPAKHVRFNMSDDIDRAKLYNVCDWAGGYLYLR
jgi:hypothetical protein|tara:strand:- start:15 stop:461 length:447 start_codon:yes stop_codon:yes gene_type:complete